ncbi:MAG: LysR family transcriptional regulator [Treponema sp.]|jgi:DNA-binding transcriptional LysR family regulator|nr:LysR family transcriptional regulator [Treponema sp.]
MTSLQIDYFLEVAKGTSFTKASEKMFVTQPVISRQIAALESELGFVLFDRAKSRPKLTPAGGLFFKLFTEYKTKLQDTVQEAKVIATALPYEVRIGCLDGWSLHSFLPEIINKLTRHYPKFKVQLEGNTPASLLAELKNGHFDVAFSVVNNFRDSPELSIQKIGEIPKILLFSVTMPQAQLEKPQPSDFDGCALFIPNAREGYLDYVRSVCRQIGFRPSGIEVMANSDSAIQAVSNGFGVMLDDLWLRELANQNFHYISLGFNDSVAVAWKTYNPNLFVHMFIDALMEHFQ